MRAYQQLNKPDRKQLNPTCPTPNTPTGSFGRHFWVLNINRRWTFCILRQWFCPNYRAKRVIALETLSNTNLLPSRHIKMEKTSLPVDVHVAKKISLLKLPSDNSPTGWVVNLIHFSPLVRPILHKNLCLTNHPKCEVTVPGCFFLWQRRLFWPSMEAEQRNNISVSPGTWTHDSTKPVFLVTSGNQGCCIIFSIFSGLILNLFGTYLQRKTGNICIQRK